MREKITVLVPCFNEEHNIRECLQSVAWADEIFVVDSGSTDRTRDIAAEFTSRLVVHEYVNSATQKNWAIPQASHPWVMVVDADERVTPELRDAILRMLENPGGMAAFRIQRRTVFFGRPIRHCGWERESLTRVFLRDKGRYEDLEVHADMIIDGAVGALDGILHHDTYQSMEAYLEKFGRYTTWSSNDLQKKGRRASWSNLALRPLFRFLKMFVLRRGFLEGKHGFVLCALAAMSVFMKYAKLWERTESGVQPRRFDQRGS